MQKLKHFYAIGLMSGTSCDGVDASLIETDGMNFYKVLDHHYRQYTPEFQAKLLQFSYNKIGDYCSIEHELTIEHFKCVEIIKSRNKNIMIDIIGFHGQTVEHIPNIYFTLQIGNPTLLAKLCDIDVIFDFRKQDMANKGEGAPLTPIYHSIIAKNHKIDYPVLFLNLGGIANITYIYQNTLIAGDIGPGNCLIDDWIQKFFHGNRYDANGSISRNTNGNVHFDIIDILLDNKFYKANFPKSLNRFYLADKDFDILRNSNISPQDGLATLIYFTAICIKIGIKKLAHNGTPKKIFVCGGGRKNKTVMNKISELCQIDTQTIEFLQENGDIIEASAFAYIAVRYMLNLPSTFPSTTGAHTATRCGVLYKHNETIEEKY